MRNLIFLIILTIISCNKQDDNQLSIKIDDIHFTDKMIEVQLINNTDTNYVFKYNPYRVRYLNSDDSNNSSQFYFILKNKEKKHINLERGIFDPIIPIPSPITGEIEDTTGLGTIKAMKRITKQTTSKEYSQPIFLEKNKTKYIKIKNPLNDHIYTNYIESTSIENVINKIEFIQLHLNQREGIITDSILSAHKSYKPFVGKVYSNTVKLIK